MVKFAQKQGYNRLKMKNNIIIHRNHLEPAVCGLWIGYGEPLITAHSNKLKWE